MCLAVSAPRDDKLREKLALPAMNRGEAAIPGALNLRRRRECVARRPRCAMQILTDRRTRRACQYLPDETFAPLAPSQEPKRRTDVEPDRHAALRSAERRWPAPCLAGAAAGAYHRRLDLRRDRLGEAAQPAEDHRLLHRSRHSLPAAPGAIRVGE